MSLLKQLHVVELQGPYEGTCSRFLASLGAEVRYVDSAAELLALAERADVIIESRGLPHVNVAARNPRLIHATISAFGSYGPRAYYRGSELVCSAMGGVLRLVGDPDRAPLKEALQACTFHAQAALAAAISLACWERESSGRGQHIDVSVQEVAASRLTNAVLSWQFDRRALERSGNVLRYGRAAVRCMWELRDGYV
ncbi:MAG TPA: CoA transferase, partial [Polyangiales bacterium]|nr:CoA transferase [Polyangiales bacterium]